MISTRSAGLVIDTVVCLTLVKWETVSGRFGGYLTFSLSTTTVSMSLTGSCFSSESAPGALPSWDSRTRRNNLLGGLAVRRTVGPSGHANSPHPSSRKGHHSTARWSSSVLLLE